MPEIFRRYQKIGFIVRADVTGLSLQSQDWVKHLPISKLLVILSRYPSDPEIYGGIEKIVCRQGMPTLQEIDEFLKGIDAVLAIETPYDWFIFAEAKRRGIKTILAPNYELIPEFIPEAPDLWLCYNSLNYAYAPEPKVYLPQPVDRDIFPFKLRERARTFLFNNGRGGLLGRNSLYEFLQAIPLVKSNVKFIVNSQYRFQAIPDPRIEARIGDQPIKEIWKEGDVFVQPRKFGANSLPINEAMSLGMPVIGVDRKPENEYLPKELLIEPDGTYEARTLEDARKITMYLISPYKIAQKIDEIANTDITKLSVKMNQAADEISWANLKEKWTNTLLDFINQK